MSILVSKINLNLKLLKDVCAQSSDIQISFKLLLQLDKDQLMSKRHKIRGHRARFGDISYRTP